MLNWSGLFVFRVWSVLRRIHAGCFLIAARGRSIPERACRLTLYELLIHTYALGQE